jgi:hypothetical protein
MSTRPSSRCKKLMAASSASDVPTVDCTKFPDEPGIFAAVLDLRDALGLLRGIRSHVELPQRQPLVRIGANMMAKSGRLLQMDRT